MAEEKQIQISLQLPVSELAAVSTLLEQIQQLLGDDRRFSAPPASAESSTFDEARFQQLSQATPETDTARQLERAEKYVHDTSETDTLKLPEFSDMSSLASTETREWQKLQNAVFDPETEGFESQEEVKFFPDSIVFSDPAAAGNAGRTDSASAENSIKTFLPERRRDARQLAAAGPAPLTAEAVSLAFRRDDRRYDSGFPLY